MRTFIWLPFVLIALVLLVSMTSAATGQATVQSESLSVFSRMDSTSGVVRTLKKGDVVVIEVSIQGEEGAWCAIREPAENKDLGYVLCRFLSSPPGPKAPTPSAALASAPRTAASAPPTALAPLDDIWDRWQKRQVSFGEMRWLGEAMGYAVLFKLSTQQKARVPLLARQNGIPNCIEETDRYMRKDQLPPDAFSSGPVTQCDWNWTAFMEQVLALVTPAQQAAHPAAYAEQRRQITGRRRYLKIRSQ
jgi:hypothetical protein